MARQHDRLGRPAASTIAVYADGRVRIPPGLVDADQVVLGVKPPHTILVRPATEVEIGWKTYGGSATRSQTIDMIRAFRRLGIEPKDVKGAYRPIMRDGTLHLVLSRAVTRTLHRGRP